MRHLLYLLIASAFVAAQAEAQTSIDKLLIGTGTANLITLQSGGLSAPELITIPDPGATANIILSATSTSQTIAGPLTINATSPNFLTLTGIAAGTAVSYLALNSSNQVVTIAGSSTMTGSGTTNDIPIWSSSTALGNSLLADNGTLSYNSTKFTVASTTGNTAIAGTLSVGSTVTLSSVASATPSFLIGLNGSNQVVEMAVPSSTMTVGTSTANTIPKWTGASALSNSLLTDNGTLLNYDAGKLVDTAATGGLFTAGTFNPGAGVVLHSSTYSATTAAATSDCYVILTGTTAAQSLTVPTGLGVGQMMVVTNNSTQSWTVLGTAQAASTTRMYFCTGTNVWVQY